jgi:two-component system chemotaxis response regulator CheB
VSKVRVLVVDDSVTIRKMLTDGLSADPEIEIVGSAANGRIALAKIHQTPPDVVTLDIEMPEMDGLETLRAIRKEHPTLPVIMFSTLTERGAAITLDALSAGATDYFTKPSNTGGVTEGLRIIRDEMAPRIKGLVRGRHVPLGPSTSRPPPAPRATPVVGGPPRSGTMAVRGDVIAIGCSTGGPNALAEVLKTFPDNLPVPVVITQHMPPLFTKLLAQRLDASTPLRVREAAAGDVLEPGLALIAPGDWHMTFRREGASKVVVVLDQKPPENSCRPAVDPMFTSIAGIYGPRTVAAVLTGMGQDGMRGSEVIASAGGFVVAQDEPTSVVWGMPGAVVRAGVASAIVPLSQVARELVSRVSRSAGSPTENRHAHSQ